MHRIAHSLSNFEYYFGPHFPFLFIFKMLGFASLNVGQLRNGST
jgi:hypothetical protein